MLNNKKLLRNSRGRSVIGIDIGNNSMRAVELAHKDNKSGLVAYGEHLWDIKTSPLILHENIIKLLDNPIFGSFVSKDINISFPRSIANNHFVVLDVSKHKNTEDYIRRFVIEKLGLDLSNYHFDYQLINTKFIDDRLAQVLMVDVVNKGFLKDITDKFDGNIRINSIVPTFAKQLSSVFEKYDESVVLVDVGHDTTKMFFCSHTHCIEKRINLGGANVTQKIADNFGLNYQRALELQKNIGLLGSDLASKIKSQIVNEINYLAQEIREFVEECIDIFNIKTSSDISIYITGSIMSTKGINQLLNKLTRYNLNIVDPWKDVGIYPLKPIPKHRLPKYAGAISLAI